MDRRIAIVGMGGVFPGGGLEGFWSAIREGRSCAREVPPGRWILPPGEAYDPRPGEADRVYSLRACFLDSGAERLALAGLDLDAALLERLDPLFHILLKAGVEAYRGAVTGPLDPARVGVIVGNIALPTEGASALARAWLGRAFAERVLGHAGPEPEPAERTEPLNRYVTGLPAGVLAKALGLGGGSLTLDAACASSLYAVKLALEELRAGRADAMLAGGVSRPDSLYTQMGFSQLRALSPSGRCAPFDARADGLVVGEGAGVFVLKRLSDALAHGDRILCTIAGIGLSNDLQGSLLAPSSEGQLRAMRAAYTEAGWSPADVDLIECHATGTPVGDAVEFESLRALRAEAGPEQARRCVIGSVKSNVGHLLTGAGAAGLAKVLLALRHEVLPPTAHFSRPGPRIALDGSSCEVLAAPRAWPRRAPHTPRRAAVSAFGFGGINAHLLLEEWQGEASRPSPAPALSAPAAAVAAPPVALVGLAAAFGPWRTLREFQERVLGGGREEAPRPPRRWWGIERSAWLADQGLSAESFAGYYLDDVRLPAGRFRIPPKELEELLPQQALMLAVAAEALRDAGLAADGRAADLGVRAGIFTGLALDLNTTQFQLRWAAPGWARAWNRSLGLGLSPEEEEAWARGLRERLGPPLTANRTMGALGGIVASRIAREFRCGGPSFGLSGEENSGLRALEMAVRALQRGELDVALVGAVDLAGDPRAVLGAHAGRPHAASGAARPFDERAAGWAVGEGAAALVLMPLERAVREGARIYAVLRGLGAASGGGAERPVPPETCALAMRRAYADARVDPATVGYLEAHGGGGAEDDAEAAALAAFFGGLAGAPRTLGSAKSDVGHAGAASGLAGLLKAALALYQEVLPPLRGTARLRGALHGHFAAHAAPRHWLRDRAAGPRRAGVNSMGVDGTCVHAVLEAWEGVTHARVEIERRQPLGARGEALFAIEGADAGAVAAGLARLARLAERAAESRRPIEALAREWWREQAGRRPASGATRAAALVARDADELRGLAEALALELTTPAGAPHAESERSAWTNAPLGPVGGVAWVFPGSGNHYPEMGRVLGVQWPELLRRQDAENLCLRGQYVPGLFWSGASADELARDARALIFGQVALGTLSADLLAASGVRADAALGYSLGESASFFALRAWRARDEMFRRMNEAPLFTRDLSGPCEAARRAWRLPEGEAAAWTVGLVTRPAEDVRRVLAGRTRVYLLIVNTPRECVIGGQRGAVEEAAAALGGTFLRLSGVTAAHCEVVREVERAYHDLHLYETTPPPGVRFYSGAWGRAYPLDRESAAGTILAHALHGLDFPKVVEAAYADGVRLFIEPGPGGSCTRMLGQILAGRPHFARALCLPGQDETFTFLRLLAGLLAERVPVELEPLYGRECLAVGLAAERAADPAAEVVLPVGGAPFAPCPPPRRAAPPATALPPVREPEPALAGVPAWAGAWAAAEGEKARAHEAFLRVSGQLARTMADNLSLQLAAAERLHEMGAQGTALLVAPPPAAAAPAAGREVFLTRAQCLEFARGSIARVLGAAFAPADGYPTRVRLPDEPLMLVDRILAVEGVPRSLASGRVVTEHDVLPGGWYLDHGRIPTCIAVEAGQADLFLSGYLGIDFETHGLARYRLLDATVTFHGPLPHAGEIIRYDIRIERFFRQGRTWLFRFRFESTVGGRPLLTMKDGCAGFFTQAELDAGTGIVHTELDRRPRPGKRPADWRAWVPMHEEVFPCERLDALRAGDLAAAFGSDFAALSLRAPPRLPGGRMRLIERVTRLEPAGGRYGLGLVRAEAEVRPDDWYLTCHFVDDQVMPGTLMYECCLHTLRVFLLRMGWVAEADATAWEPVPGVASQLRCRGQVIATTRVAAYEIVLKELGYGPEPYAIADALMYADGKPIVEITNLSLRLSGATREGLAALWDGAHAALNSPSEKALSLPSPARGEGEQQPHFQRAAKAPVVAATPSSAAKPALFDRERILAFAVGKPSEAFGEPYRVFDQDRVIARLPGPPYQFLDRITEISAEPWKLAAGGEIEAQYAVPPDAWYFQAARQAEMPFAVLLEVALQPCGWLAAYLGSALTSAVDLSFRNLGGTAVQLLPVERAAGTLAIRVKITKVARSGGMIIQHYDFEVRGAGGPVYRGNTYFGFFSKQALAQQVGVRDARPFEPPAEQLAHAETFAYPDGPPYPESKWRMVDRIETWLPAGGPAGLGFIAGRLDVDPGAWFFKAHFHQDPVIPGSLGLESFLQLLQVAAARRWGLGPRARFHASVPGRPHEWIYRGQVLPSDKQVTVQASIEEADDAGRLLSAGGFLAVDGRVIYQMKNFTLRADGT